MKTLLLETTRDRSLVINKDEISSIEQPDIFRAVCLVTMKNGNVFEVYGNCRALTLMIEDKNE